MDATSDTPVTQPERRATHARLHRACPAQPPTGESLRGIAVLALVLARGSNDANDGPAYTDAEIAARFGVTMGGGMAEDPVHHDFARGESHLVVLGEAGMPRAQRDKGGMRVGMNLAGYDNRHLAINILRWLSRVL